MKNKKIFIWISAIVAVLGVLLLVGWFIFKKDIEEAVTKTVLKYFEHLDRVDAKCLAFEEKYSRWPKDIAELQNFINENKENGNLDLRQYKNLTLTETPEKSLKIHYDLYVQGRVAHGTYAGNGVYDEELKMDSLKK
jgi:hypothetical protein